jgi:hypothetical protein
MLAVTLLGFTISTIWAVILLTIWIAIAFWPASIARSKGHSFFLWFLISIPFWWISLFVAFALKDRNAASAVVAQNPPHED